MTNPPIDPLREGLVMSLEMRLGKRGNLLNPGPDSYVQVLQNFSTMACGAKHTPSSIYLSAWFCLSAAVTLCWLVCKALSMAPDLICYSSSCDSANLDSLSAWNHVKA